MAHPMTPGALGPEPVGLEEPVYRVVALAEWFLSASSAGEGRARLELPADGRYLIPDGWFRGSYQRVCVHWTVGGPTPNSVDREHYHLLVDQRGRLHQTDFRIGGPPWPGHVLGFNTGTVGVSMCGMRGAVQGQTLGNCPLTELQWETAARAVAELLCRRHLEVSYQTCFQHAEVEAIFQKPQRGKWDCTVVQWDRSLDPREVCRDFRLRVMRHHAALTREHWR